MTRTSYTKQDDVHLPRECRERPHVEQTVFIQQQRFSQAQLVELISSALFRADTVIIASLQGPAMSTKYNLGRPVI